MTDPTTARDRAAVRISPTDGEFEDASGAYVRKEDVLAELLQMRALPAAPTADVAATEWAVERPDGFIGSYATNEPLARRVAEQTGEKLLRRDVTAWVPDDPAAPEGVDAAAELARVHAELTEYGDKYVAAVRELTAAQAAIQRVQAECDQAEKRAHEMVGIFSGKKGAEVPAWVSRVRRALDGEDGGQDR